LRALQRGNTTQKRHLRIKFRNAEIFVMIKLPRKSMYIEIPRYYTLVAG